MPPISSTPQSPTPQAPQSSPNLASSNSALAARDLAHIWHPCTQMKEHEQLPPIPIKSARGARLFDFAGREYIDCISSWWVNLFGHCNARINAAISEQLESLEHVLLAGFTHEPIIKLSQRLCALLPESLGKCFYADNGSSAIEVALKMSYHYHYNTQTHATPESKAAKRTKFLSLANAYHGETIGALSVGDLGLYKATYEPILLSNIIAPVPDVFAAARHGQSSQNLQNLQNLQNSQNLHATFPASAFQNGVLNPALLDSSEYYERELLVLESILQEQGEEICALILEPLIQCAGGMHIYPRAFVQKACELARSYGILIIFDEIAVGFGRSGSMFAYEQCGVVPDFLCLSKGITGGYMPLSVVITSDEVYNAFYAPYETQKAFLHSHSYTGNALACSAANAVLDIFEQENIIEKNLATSAYIAGLWSELAELPIVQNLRGCGMVFALDLCAQAGADGQAGRRLGAGVGRRQERRLGKEVYLKALERGLLLRPLGDTIYFMPPYVITREEIERVISTLREILVGLGG